MSFAADVKEQWIRCYLRGKLEAQGQDPNDLSDTEVEVWMTELGIMEVVSSRHYHHHQHKELWPVSGGNVYGRKAYYL